MGHLIVKIHLPGKGDALCLDAAARQLWYLLSVEILWIWQMHDIFNYYHRPPALPLGEPRCPPKFCYFGQPLPQPPLPHPLGSLRSKHRSEKCHYMKVRKTMCESVRRTYAWMCLDRWILYIDGRHFGGSLASVNGDQSSSMTRPSP